MVVKLIDLIKLDLDWFGHVDNRKKIYKAFRAIGPLLILGGFFTPEEFTIALDAVAALLIISGSSLADKNAQ